ncbi:MAG: hypothetical protein V3V98_07105 [Thermoplasmata archaeon]
MLTDEIPEPPSTTSGHSWIKPLIAGLVILAFAATYALLETDSTEDELDSYDDFFGTRNDDCGSCHFSINQTLAGGKHSIWDCTICHDPAETSQLVLIKDCTECHGSRHDYSNATECVNCHDPHATGFQHDISNQLCQDCHTNETAELDMGPHDWQDCTNCHGNHSELSNSCATCHGVKHADLTPGGFQYPECLQCHEPMNTSFRHDVSNDQCQDCHSSEFWRLQEGGHIGENCTDCHTHHEEITIACDECHGQYHGYSYPKCLECHEPMKGTPGPGESDLSQEAIAFAVIAIVAAIAISSLLIIHMRRKED